MDTLTSVRNDIVHTSMPKFKYEYSIEMSNALISLGLSDAFDAENADFSKIGVSPEGPLYIGNVLHKTFISVDELGTKAGAATLVATSPGAAPNPEPPKTVNLDRPFVYAIIDNLTSLPVFIGAVMTL